jgi:hypothetical protein
MLMVITRLLHNPINRRNYEVKIGDQKLYLRNLISRVKKIENKFNPTQNPCECGGRVVEGTYVVSYWKKELKLPYFICETCGIQSEPKENPSAIMNFVTGLA